MHLFFLVLSCRFLYFKQLKSNTKPKNINSFPFNQILSRTTSVPNPCSFGVSQYKLATVQENTPKKIVLDRMPGLCRCLLWTGAGLLWWAGVDWCGVLVLAGVVY